MANLIDMTTNTLSQNTFCFEEVNLDTNKIPVPIENAKFGILNFTAVTSTEISGKIDFVFTVDCSGSMSDMCSDGRSKMQHIIYTLKNMILFIHENASEKSNITIYAFDVQIYKIVERTKITDDNCDSILAKVEKIRPLSSTNIEIALKKTAEYIEELKTLYPDNLISHIFMTDGEATDGSSDMTLLKSLVVDNVMNSFIGFGIEHDASLLNGIASVGKSSYHFIDKLESACFVYGEILHSVLYKILTDCEIQLKNGLIYDFKTNTWTDNLKIEDIISEANKTYNIVSNNIDEFSVNIQGTLDNLVVLYPSRQIDNDDLSKHVFRQRTLQLMYEVNDYCNKKRENDRGVSFRRQLLTPTRHDVETENPMKILRDNLKKNLSDFMTEMKKFMTDNGLEEDKFMKNLCDDIYICFRTFDTKFGNMYCNARQTSQGTQRQYTVTSVVNETENNNVIRRGRRIQRQTNAIHNFEFNPIALDDIDVPIMEHEISGLNETPYSTLHTTQVIRFVSGTVGNDDNDNTVTQKY